MKLIKTPRAAWKHYSTQALTAAAGLQGAWLGLPEPIRQALPPEAGQVVAWVTLVVTVLGLGGKFVDQTPAKKLP